MKKNNESSTLLIMGVIVLMAFCGIVAMNMLPESITSKAYYAKNDEEMNAKIENIAISDSKLSLITSGEASSYCIKTTKTNPNEQSICWKELTSNETSISVLSGKKYYVWIKDSNGRISSPQSIQN